MQITFIRESARDCAIRCTCDDGAVLAVRTYSRPLGLPHDLAHYVVERDLGWAWGFWGLVAAGAKADGLPSGAPRCSELSVGIGLAALPVLIPTVGHP